MTHDLYHACVIPLFESSNRWLCSLQVGLIPRKGNLTVTLPTSVLEGSSLESAALTLSARLASIRLALATGYGPRQPPVVNEREVLIGGAKSRPP